MQVENQIARSFGIYGTVDHLGRRFVVWQPTGDAEVTVVGHIHPSWEHGRTMEAIVHGHEAKARAIAAERRIDAELPHFVAYLARVPEGIERAAEVDRREGHGAFRDRIRAGIAAAMAETDPFRRAVAFERVVQAPCDVEIVTMMKRSGLDVSAAASACAAEAAEEIERRLAATAAGIHETVRIGAPREDVASEPDCAPAFAA